MKKRKGKNFIGMWVDDEFIVKIDYLKKYYGLNRTGVIRMLCSERTRELSKKD